MSLVRSPVDIVPLREAQCNASYSLMETTLHSIVVIDATPAFRFVIVLEVLLKSVEQFCREHNTLHAVWSHSAKPVSRALRPFTRFDRDGLADKEFARYHDIRLKSCASITGSCISGSSRMRLQLRTCTAAVDNDRPQRVHACTGHAYVWVSANSKVEIDADT